MTPYKNKIMKLTPGDLPVVSGLIRDFRDSINLPYHEEVFVPKMSEMMNKGVAHFFVYKDKEVKGFLAFTISEDLLSSLTFAVELGWWVDPEHRGGMIARRLFSAYESFSKEQGVDKITMIHLVGDNGEQLSKIYKKMGYVPLENQYIKDLSSKEIVR